MHAGASAWIQAAGQSDERVVELGKVVEVGTEPQGRYKGLVSGHEFTRAE
jgi:hypothetical protein